MVCNVRADSTDKSGLRPQFLSDRVHQLKVDLLYSCDTITFQLIFRQNRHSYSRENFGFYRIILIVVQQKNISGKHRKGELTRSI